MKFKVGDIIIDDCDTKDTGKVVKVTKNGIHVKWFTINGLPNLTKSVAEYDSEEIMCQYFRLMTKLERVLK